VHVSKEQSVAGVTEQRAGHLQMRKRDFRKVLLLFLGGECYLWMLILQRQPKEVRCNGCELLLLSAVSSQTWLCLGLFGEVAEKELRN